MRITLLLLSALSLVVTLTAFWYCSGYDSPGEMLASKAAMVAAASLGFAFLGAMAAIFIGVFEQRGIWKSVIDDVAADSGIHGGETEPDKLIRIVDGTSFQSLGQRQAIDHGVCGRASGSAPGTKLAILMLQYSWDGGDRTRSKILPMVVSVQSVPQALQLSLNDGPFPDENVSRELSEILRRDPSLEGECLGGTVYLAFRHNALRELVWGLKHPLSTMRTRLRQNYEAMLEALPHIVDALNRNAS